MQVWSWHDLTGADTFRIMDYMVVATPTVQRLCMDLSVSPIDLPMFHESIDSSLHSFPSDELMLSQIFNTPSAVSAAREYLSGWEVLPSAIRYSCLACLDIKVSAAFYPLLQWALDHVKGTLTELVLHLGSSIWNIISHYFYLHPPVPVDPATDDSCPLSLNTLKNLSHLSVYTAPRTVGFALLTIATWSSLNRADSTSTFVLVVVVHEGDVNLLHRFLVFGSIQPVLVGSVLDRSSSFSSDMYLLLNMPLPISQM